MVRLLRFRVLASLVSSLFATGLAEAADAASFTLIRADTGITIQRANGKLEPAAANRTVAPADRLCFTKAQTQIALKAPDSQRTIEYAEPGSGCRTIKDIVARSSAESSQSSLSAFKHIWSALTVEKQRDTSAVVSAARGATTQVNGTPRTASPYCEVPAHTNWFVLDTLDGIYVPLYSGATAELAPVSGDGKTAGIPVALTAADGGVRLPKLGAPGDTFQLMLTSKDKSSSCKLRISVAAAKDSPAAAPVVLTTDSQSETGIAVATHALSILYQHGRAWNLEGMRQLAPYQTGAPEARMAARYLATPNAECANIDTDNPVRFDMPLLRAKKSYLIEGTRNLYLAWRGGMPPYRIKVERQGDGSRVVEHNEQWNCEVLFPAAHLTPGAYRITLTDAKGEAFEENNLEVVPTPRRPVSPTATSWLDQAQWLAEQQDGAWRFEATQTVAARLAESSEAQAWIFRNAMVNSPAK